MYKAGEKPTANKIKAKWNEVRRVEFPWSLDVTKCAGSQGIMNLGTAFKNFFEGLKKPKGHRRAKYPKFKKKRLDASFALWNDQFEVRALPFRFGKDRGEIRIPNLGWVKMREPLKASGRIMGAVVSRDADGWSVSIQCKTEDPTSAHINPCSVVGVDLGISCLMVLSQPLSDGRTRIENPKALRKAMKRVKKLSRRCSRQEVVRKKHNAKTSRREKKRRLTLAKIHLRVANVRRDAIHKATTALANTFETVVLEALNVAGMVKNHNLAGALHDAAFGEIRRQVEYKTAMRGGRTVIADRFFASSKIASCCGHLMEKMPLNVREWTCPACGTIHDRDENAARNLEQIVVGPAWSEPLPGNPVATHGEIPALAVAASVAAVKPRSTNRELNRCASLRTN
jgi:putative transposase